MGILLAFLPFIVYVVVERLAGIRLGLLAATGIAAGLLLRDLVSRERKIKLLELGTTVSLVPWQPMPFLRMRCGLFPRCGFASTPDCC